MGLWSLVAILRATTVLSNAAAAQANVGAPATWAKRYLVHEYCQVTFAPATAIRNANVLGATTLEAALVATTLEVDLEQVLSKANARLLSVLAFV